LKEVIKEVPVTQVREVIKEIPREVVQEVVKEVPVVQIQEVVKEVFVDVPVIKEVIREVPHVQYTESIREVPREIVQEVVREVQVPRRHEVIREVAKEVRVKEVVREVEMSSQREYVGTTSEIVYSEPRTRELYRQADVEESVAFRDAGVEEQRVGAGPAASLSLIATMDSAEVSDARETAVVVKENASTKLPAGARHWSAACPQHLSDINGIGSVFETRLYAANIGTFWEVTCMTNENLMKVLKVDDPKSLDVSLTEIRADALRLARETDSIGRTWSGDAPDDFEPYQGIGYWFEKRLYDAGICTHEVLANSSVEQLEIICIRGDADQRPGYRRPNFQSWIDQAKAKVASKTA
jgi:predicted flap endonuclease-1-like 5' DNA nuclease